MLGENTDFLKLLIFICMKAPSGNLAKAMQFSLENLKVAFECL